MKGRGPSASAASGVTFLWSRALRGRGLARWELGGREQSRAGLRGSRPSGYLATWRSSAGCRKCSPAAPSPTCRSPAAGWRGRAPPPRGPQGAGSWGAWGGDGAVLGPEVWLRSLRPWPGPRSGRSLRSKVCVTSWPGLGPCPTGMDTDPWVRLRGQAAVRGSGARTGGAVWSGASQCSPLRSEACLEEVTGVCPREGLASWPGRARAAAEGAGGLPQQAREPGAAIGPPPGTDPARPAVEPALRPRWHLEPGTPPPSTCRSCPTSWVAPPVARPRPSVG